MPDTTKKLSKEEFVTYKRSFDSNKYLVNYDVRNLLTGDGETEHINEDLEGLDIDAIMKLRRVPRHVAEAYYEWMENPFEQTKEDDEKLLTVLKSVCSHPELILVNDALWCDIEMAEKWSEFNEGQDDGYKLGGKNDDFTDIGTGALLNEDAFLDAIAHVCDASEEED